MITKKFMLVLLSVFIAICLLSSVSQTMAETRKGKTFHGVATKVEMVPIPNAEGHVVAMFVREGVNTYEDGEQGWNKTVVIWDGIKTVGSFVQYTMVTFQDGSTTITYSKGGEGQFSGEIIYGTGRFQGIKGTVTGTYKNLPPEKGEIIGKGLSEWTLTYTLPPK
jgi:hypothetical protein